MNLIKAQMEAAVVAQIVAAFDGEDDETIRQAIQDGTCIEEIMRALLNAIAEDESMEEAISIRQRELAERKGRFGARRGRVRDVLSDLMQRANLRKLELAEATLSLSNSPQSVRITDENAIPDQFLRIKKEPDKAAIKDALKSGDIVAGAELSNGGQSLTIRRK